MRLNMYSCPNGHRVTTVDIDEGTTPFMIRCPECKQDMRSSFYRVPQNAPFPTMEWRRATKEELDLLKASMITAKGYRWIKAHPRGARKKLALWTSGILQHHDWGGLFEFPISEKTIGDVNKYLWGK